eukprot:TRINITY_DN39820_c0_g1_i1.p1 TRINITY_DN39820_c0_g1~~TRINITY_DN39820_c0_g1_i1.p1  ORF type:complete len:595 (+),score=43.77 TRINITY_DN39820_c0_g1_i1:57-1841(+)
MRSDARSCIAHYVGILCAHRARFAMPRKFRYVILSYKRAAILKKYTWAYLKKCGIPDERILIVVQNPQCYREYKAAGFPDVSVVEISTSGYVAAFNRVFAPSSKYTPLVDIDEFCVQMDDDVIGLLSVGRQLYPSGRPQPMQVLNLDSVMNELMETMEVSGCNLCGFSPHQKNTPWIVKEALYNRVGDQLSLRFVNGQARVIRNKGLRLELPTGKSDYELTIRYFQADGGTVRSSMSVSARSYTGGCDVSSQLAEAQLLQRHFPQEIVKIVEHPGGTTSLCLARMTYGESNMLARMRQEMAERLGELLCKKVIKEVDREIVAEKLAMRLKHEARKHLSQTDQLSAMKEEYDSLMVSRYGDNFDSISRMVPFPTFSEESYAQMILAQQMTRAQKTGQNVQGKSSKLKHAPQHRAIGITTARKAPCARAKLEDRVRVAVAALRDSKTILKSALIAPDAPDTFDLSKPQRRICKCKVCGQLGHYAKRCGMQTGLTRGEERLQRSGIRRTVQQGGKAMRTRRARAEVTDSMGTTIRKRPSGVGRYMTQVRRSSSGEPVGLKQISARNSTHKRPAGVGVVPRAGQGLHKRPAGSRAGDI